MHRRLGASGQGGVADNGFGIGMLIVGIGKHRALLLQAFEAARFKALPRSGQQIGPKAVNGQLQHQSDVWVGCLRLSKRQANSVTRVRGISFTGIGTGYICGVFCLNRNASTAAFDSGRRLLMPS